MEGRTCATPGCTKAATLRCPTCRELGSSEDARVFFCSQDCFKTGWVTHKLFHQELRQAAALKLATELAAASGRGVRLPKSFEGFEFTGPLRPGEVTPRVSVPAGIPKPDYADDGRPLSEMKMRGSNVITIHNADEIVKAREAGRIAREVLDVAAAALRPGITGDEIDKIVHAECMRRGVYPSPLNYHGFPKSVCVSPNEVICHGIPDTRPITDGEIVNLDVTIYTADGFHSDLNETYVVGNVDAKGRALVKCAYECLQAAIAVSRPGVMYRDLGTVITKVAAKYGFSVVKSFCGHGIGKLFHCAPNVPHYAKNKAVGTMLPGHIFTIEPMINEGGPGDVIWPDEWTAVTSDGKRSAQFEHTLLVTETGVEVLTARPGAPGDKLVWDEAAVARPLPAPAPASDGGAGAAAEPAK